jgi:hypothetical protein
MIAAWRSCAAEQGSAGQRPEATYACSGAHISEQPRVDALHRRRVSHQAAQRQVRGEHERVADVEGVRKAPRAALHLHRGREAHGVPRGGCSRAWERREQWRRAQAHNGVRPAGDVSDDTSPVRAQFGLVPSVCVCSTRVRSCARS